jgi:hypothetical protein
MPEVVTEISISPVALRVPWRDAAKEIHAHLKIGRAIKNQKIRDQWELDHARAEKAEWIRRTSELLNRCFTSEQVAEQALLYVGPVLPEYAEFDLFVDQFEDEMRHRLARLQGVLKQLDTLPEAVPSASGTGEDEIDDPIEAEAEAQAEVEAEAKANAEIEAVAQPTQTETKKPETKKAESKKNAEQPIVEEIKMSASAVAPAVSVTVKTPIPSNGDGHSVVSVPRIVPQSHASTGVEGTGLLILATHDDSVRKSIGEFLHDLGFKLDIIDRVAQPGRSVVDLLGPESEAAFAVVVADAAAIKDATGDWQFELGYCSGRLGAGRVCVATATNETLSDKHGIRHLGIDPNGGWQLQMARYLKRAGVPLDLNRLC